VVKKYIIKDLQDEGRFSPYTTVEGIFQSCVEDYMSNNWTETEAAELEKEFASFDEYEKIHFVSFTYDYEFIASPDEELIQEWETDTDGSWEEELQIAE
jgi:hypothetical protein